MPNQTPFRTATHASTYSVSTNSTLQLSVAHRAYATLFAMILLATGWFVTDSSAARADDISVLPGTQPLIIEQPLDELMLSGLERFADRRLQEMPAVRDAAWKRDFSSLAAYEAALQPHRNRLKELIGAVDARIPATGLELISTTSQDAIIARGPGYNVLAVRWPVLDGVFAEGLLLQPQQTPVARCVVVPDASWTPEMIAGIAPGCPAESQLARRLVEQNVQVLVPSLVNRDDEFSGHPDIRYTNISHREWVYRPAFELGRHLIGFEVQKILAGIDQLADLNSRRKTDLPLGVAGIGDGAALTLFAAAIDPRITSTLVSGDFQPRELVWQQPIDRNIWSQLTLFGDAEIAAMIAPRRLVIEAAAAPMYAGPAAPREGRSNSAAPGTISPPQPTAVQAEFGRLKPTYDQLSVAAQLTLVMSGARTGAAGTGAAGTGAAATDPAIEAFLSGLKITSPLKPSRAAASDSRTAYNVQDRQKRTVQELIDFTQKLLRRSARVRDTLWSTADRSTPVKWLESTAPLKTSIIDNMLGKLPYDLLPANPRSRKIITEPAFTGYEVMLDVAPDIVAGGILLLPNDIQPGEQRPVVVCQHGLEGVPMDTITAEGTGYQYYKSFAAELARRGFITFSPQNPYRGVHRFRQLVRRLNPCGMSLWSVIIPQHQQIISFLKTIPSVDSQRIGFYGLSYGGKTAMRVPVAIPEYCLSICSADFNEWVVKNAAISDPYSYLFTFEYEIFEWNMGHLANYAELGNQIFPRPFMVERGHDDGVAPDEWVAWEYAKIRRHYDRFGLGDRTEIEFFNGPHTINGKATFDFLHRHLNWPKK